jgi:hypothetical protein
MGFIYHLALIAATLTRFIQTATTFSSIVTATNWIGWVNYFNDKPAYLDSDGFVNIDTLKLNSTLTNFTDFACSSSKQICLVATGFIVTAFTSDGTRLKKNEAYRTRDQASIRINSKIGIIENSEYFLTSSLSKYGVARWKYGNTDSFSNLNFTGISDSLDTYDLLVIPSSAFAIISYTAYNSLVVINFATMIELKKINVNTGLLAPLTSDLSKGYLVNSLENCLVKIDYYQGTIKGNVNTLPYTHAIKNVPGSDWVIVVGYRSLMIYDLSGDLFSTWSQKYYQSTTTSISGLLLDQVVGSLLSFGPGFITSVTETEQVFCHPYCSSCSTWLTPNFCSTCSSLASVNGTTCSPAASAITAPPGGAINYNTTSWSDDNMKPAPPGGFDIKKYYFYFMIGGAAIIGICCVYCFFKICCCGDSKEKTNKVHNDDDYDD